MQEPATRENTAAIADLLIGKAAEYHGKTPPEQEGASRADETIAEQAQDAPQSEEVETDEAQGAPGEDETEQSDEVSLKDLAEMLDVPEKELYSVKLPLGNNEFTTLGQFKDTFKRLQKIDDEQAAFAEHRRKQENEILVARRQTEALVNMLVQTGQVTPDRLAAVENEHRATMIRENKSAQAVMPHWSDPAARERDFDAFVELGAEYGFSDVEIRNIPDHRILKMLYDFSAAKRHAKESKNGKTPPKTIGGQSKVKQKSSTLAERKRQAKRHGGAVKNQLIADMITGKQPLD